ncbi:hypothetical protein BDK51DRAFT_52690 [Blyttiomyces helicus]|uniref:RGS domain-containing protein n=1 Tax=Blyttiomyces helicus TaxID=388810 RepID=A0A4P9W294_9FUNG|nr:hypothetical protein BDK51DRAFT_52690 [Blyttiomyces helicus]|eukprot:RKO86254.1 hypothetical protein BDK51DRAFT_52690 [Blyttiomyces helicus]
MAAACVICYALYFGWFMAPQSLSDAFPGPLWHITFLTTGQYMMVMRPVVEAIRSQRRRTTVGLHHSMASFQEVLSDRQLFDEFKAFAMADFCLESALFIEALEQLAHAASLASKNKSVFNVRRASKIARIGRLSVASISGGDIMNRSGGDFLGKSGDNVIGGNSGADLLQPPKPLEGAEQPVPEAVISQYRAFYETYVKTMAMHEVNLTAPVRDAVKRRIESVGLMGDGFGGGMGDPMKRQRVKTSLTPSITS